MDLICKTNVFLLSLESSFVFVIDDAGEVTGLRLLNAKKGEPMCLLEFRDMATAGKVEKWSTEYRHLVRMCKTTGPRTWHLWVGDPVFFREPL